MSPYPAFLLLCLSLLACAGSSGGARPEPRLSLVATRQLDIREPSGLALDVGNAALWAVGNHPDRIYKLSLDGQTLGELDYRGEDLEGIALDPADTTLWVVEERRREVLHLNVRGEVLGRQRLDLAGKPNSGLEGICLDKAGKLFVLQEKKPGLFVELNADLSIRASHRLDFASDYSDLACDRRDNGFWVLSDQNQSLFLWSPDVGVMGIYPVSCRKPEGVAVDEVNGLIYVASESENRLYVYTFRYPE